MLGLQAHSTADEGAALFAEDAALKCAAKTAAQKAKQAAAEKARKAAEKAAEKTAKDMAKQIQKDLGAKARRAFHDMKELGDRSKSELKQHAQQVYDDFKGSIPSWMKP